MSIGYCKQSCTNDPPPPPSDELCYDNETAWAFGERYISKGNWATYVTYSPNSVAILYAGKFTNVGTAHFSEADSDGNVKITINLTNGWMLDERNSYTEPIKVQGYDTAPSGNPSPGSFTSYKGTEFEFFVPKAKYYGVHLDVIKTIKCEDIVPTE